MGWIKYFECDVCGKGHKASEDEETGKVCKPHKITIYVDEEPVLIGNEVDQKCIDEIKSVVEKLKD